MKRTDHHRRDQGGAVHGESSPRLVDRDVNLRAVAYTVGAILGVTILAAALMWWLLAAFLSGAEAADPRPGPAAASAPRELPPGPRLQARPEVDLLRIEAREELILGSYAWTEDGGVRIPIERAIAALAARGDALAVGTSEAAPVAGGAIAGQPTASPTAPPPAAFGAGAEPADPDAAPAGPERDTPGGDPSGDAAGGQGADER